MPSLLGGGKNNDLYFLASGEGRSEGKGMAAEASSSRPPGSLGGEHWPHPFRSTSEMMEAYGLTAGRKSHWRLTEFRLCEINGLPGSRGRLVATDGILCLIKGESETLFEGHLASVVFEEGEDRSVKPSRNGTKAKTKEEKELEEEYDKL